ncbi:SixA phosphatase family protein [Streptomyces sp. NPDC053367]|uniref:SixA phosphatase family protein n=1 Tax=Streptomyces sp. NPDC053367 TaxID=3365700 RepID=UPI0037D626EC
MSADTTRRVVIFRHAKADRSDVDDHDRPLAERGRKEAPAAGRWLAEFGITPDLALCSTAEHCRETWKLAVSELSQRPRTKYDDRLYEASQDELITVLNEISEDVNDAVLIGHNPGLHSLADALTGEADGDLQTRMDRSGFPTSAVAVLTFNRSWSDVKHGAGRLTAFWTPHTLS